MVLNLNSPYTVSLHGSEAYHFFLKLDCPFDAEVIDGTL